MTKFRNEFLAYQAARKSHWRDFPAYSNKRGAYYHYRLSEIYKSKISSDLSILELGCGNGKLLQSLRPRLGLGIDFALPKQEVYSDELSTIKLLVMDAHDFDLGDSVFDCIIASDLLNDAWDVQAILNKLHVYSKPTTRLILNFYSQAWNFPLRIARALNLAGPTLTQNWLTEHDVINFLDISDFELVSSSKEILIPIHLPLLSSFANRYLAKLWPFNLFDLTNFVVARPISHNPPADLSVSIIIAARNEAGHINELVSRIPIMGSHTEIIFVEGGSSDDTYNVIKNTIANYPELDIKLLKQKGKGKGDAVRAGFDIANGDVLMILDADITVPPEDLPRFYHLISTGKAEFVNGVRLVYPMEEKAMRFLNLLGNKFFSWAFSWLLGQPIRDTLCGTKVLSKKSYLRIKQNRSYFGDFDPFGDFDLLFGAAKLNLKILEVPVRYRARSYGETNISRWSHGWLLLKMVIFAARKIKFV